MEARASYNESGLDTVLSAVAAAVLLFKSFEQLALAGRKFLGNVDMDFHQ